MTIWVLEQQTPTGEWTPVRDSAGVPLAYATRKGALRALSLLPHHTKGVLARYRITPVKD